LFKKREQPDREERPVERGKAALGSYTSYIPAAKEEIDDE
jgi:hypothetical protein